MKVRIKNPIYGVPITFPGNWCQEQFEIVGLCASSRSISKKNPNESAYLNGKRLYIRFLIRQL